MACTNWGGSVKFHSGLPVSPARRSAFQDHVVGIVGRGSQPQMVGIAADRIIPTRAVMADKQSHRYEAMCHLVGKFMGGYDHSTPQSKLAIPIGTPGCSPRPASALDRLVDLGPEPSGEPRICVSFPAGRIAGSGTELFACADKQTGALYADALNSVNGFEPAILGSHVVPPVRGATLATASTVRGHSLGMILP